MYVKLHFFRIAVSFVFFMGAVCVAPASAEEVENAEEAEQTEEEIIVYEMEAITVTGSRIKSDEHLTPAPVVVLSQG